jgi:hypothetical protein
MGVPGDEWSNGFEEDRISIFASAQNEKPARAGFGIE